jgi:putative inorganic carbon (HCO3(-)) transporter
VRLSLRRNCALVADHEIYPLALAVGLATFSPRWVPWGLGLIALLWLVRWVGRGKPTVRTPLDWPAIALLLMVPVTFYATTDRQATFAHVSRLLAGLALTYGLANWARRGTNIALLALALSGLGLGMALFGLISVDWRAGGPIPLVPRQIYARLPTLVQDTVHHNVMAGALLMLLPFPLSMLLTGRHVLPSVAPTVPRSAATLLDAHWLRTASYAAATLSMSGVLILTQSRGGWVAGGVAVFVVLVRHRRPFLWLIPVTLVALGGLTWRGEPPNLLSAVNTGGALSGWEGRVELWSRALCMIQDFPFTGIGAGTFNAVADSLYPLFLAGPDVKIPHAHNLLLQVGVDLGIPGLVAFLSIALLAVWSAADSARFYRRAGQEALAALAWAGLASLVGMLVHGLVDATTWVGGRACFAPWAVIGTVVALENRPKLAPHDSGWKGMAHPAGQMVTFWRIGGLVLLLGATGLGCLYLLFGGRQVAEQPSIRLPLYPVAEDADVRTQDPPSASWAGPLEVATFTTTDSITQVIRFYSDALAVAGWQAYIETSGSMEWGGIYTSEGGYSICMLNVYHIERDVWTSIVCGDRTAPLDLPHLPPLPTPIATPDSAGRRVFRRERT